MLSNWVVRTADPAVVQAISSELGLLRLTAQVLAGRGAGSPNDARQMLAVNSDALHSPWLMSSMQVAVDRIVLAIQRKENITIYGDYDVDGQTATALLVIVLRRLKAQVGYYIPSRMAEGYGLNAQAVREIAETSTLLITVDCGTTAINEVALAASLGMDCIVTDHHEPAGAVAAPLALINPKLSDSSYPWPHLAGVGVAYKLAVALADCLQQPAVVADLLDLVAMGTVADVVPLTNENRVLVHMGLAKLNKAPLPGLAALAAASRLSPGAIESHNVAFHMAPRLNAGGRVSHATTGVEMMLAPSLNAALPAAEKLDQENRTRQSIEERILAEAKELAAAQQDAPVLVVAGAGWHSGVIGIVASRLVELYGRPTFVLACDGEFATASGRSVAGFHLTEALEKHARLLERFGGHAMAAGFTVRVNRIDDLRAALVTTAQEMCGGEVPPPVVEVDTWADLTELDTQLLQELNQLGPFGHGNPAPVLGCRTILPKNVKTVGKDNSVLRLVLPVGRSQITAVGFRLGHLAASIEGPQDLAFTLTLNEWQGEQHLELRLRHLRAAVDIRTPESIVTETAAASETILGSISPLKAEGDTSVTPGSQSHAPYFTLGQTLCFQAEAYQRNQVAYVQSLLQRDLVPLVWSLNPNIRSALHNVLQPSTLQSTPANRWDMCSELCPPVGPWCLVLLSPPVGAQWRAAIERLRTVSVPVEVHLAYSFSEIGAAQRLIAADWPDREGLVQAYRELRQMEQSGAVVVPQRLEQRTGLSAFGARLALQVFAELGLVDAARSWSLLPQPGSKLDLQQAVSYNSSMALRQADTQLLADNLPQAIFNRVLNGWITN